MSEETKDKQPVLNPEQQEDYLIALAFQAIEEDFRNGTASSQLKHHFAKLGSVRAYAELEKLRTENALLKEKIKSEQAARETEALFQKALEAFASYRFDQDGDEFYMEAYDDDEDVY